MSSYLAILDHLPAALLVVFRIGGLMIFGPVFGSSVIPVRIRVFTAFALGLAAYGLLEDRLHVGEGLTLDLWTLAPRVAMELLIGLVIGYVASLPLLAMQTGGLIMGQQMGLGFAQLYNPAIEDEADIVGQMMFFMAMAGFLAIGGHESMVLAVLHSFEHVQLGGFVPDASIISLATGLLMSALELALRVSAPLLALIFLETVAMGFLAKTVPQLNILSLGFPIRILGGLLIVALGLVVINDVTMEGVNDAITTLFEWIDQSSDSTPEGAAAHGG
jgi:flagellar biosynthetic protein FliR